MTLYRRRRRWLDKALIGYSALVGLMLLFLCGCLFGLLLVLSRMEGRW